MWYGGRGTNIINEEEDSICVNPVLSGFTSDVKALRKLTKLQTGFVINLTHFN